MTRILVIRFSSIGDIVLTTPVVRCLKTQLPECEIHFLTKSSYQSIVESNPYIDQVHTLGERIIETALSMKALGFDYIIDLHGNLRTQLIKAITAIPAFTFNKLNIEKWLLVSTGINLLPQKHIVERYLETTLSLGVKNDEQGLDYFIPNETQLPIDLPKDFIALVIGAQHYTKRMPTDKLRALCMKIQHPLVLLGGKEDVENGNLVAQGLTHVINYCGKLSLHESAAVLQHASKVISHDTGLMHIAAALKKEIISIWGNTIPEFGMYPYYGKNPISQYPFQVSELDCRPCSKIGYQQCPKGHFHCMNNQDMEAMVKAVLG